MGDKQGAQVRRERINPVTILGYIGLALLVVWLFAHATGCDRARYALDAASYERELDACLVDARDAGRSLAVYEQCASEADRRHGVDAGRD